MKEFFRPEQFTPTQFSTRNDKAKFANHFIRFVESDFKESLFYDWFYRRLSQTFGHIAHYNRHGFYEEFFTTNHDKRSFLVITRDFPGWGSPEHTFCDVEKLLSHWVEGSGLIEKLADKIAFDHEAAERRELERLKAKYE